jgi:putative chitinase
MVTLADLHAISGVRSNSATTKAILAAFNKYAAAYGVDTKQRIALCLAHISVETGGFRRLDENLNYSAKRLRQVWPSRFKADAVARKYARNPQALANYVYGNRLGNKGRPNAGWLYRGSGPGQVTGYDNFLKVERETGIPFTSKPDLMRDPDMGMKGTLILWQKWGMNELADKEFVTVSRKKWNGGTHGLSETLAAWSRGLKRDLSVPPAEERFGQPSSASKSGGKAAGGFLAVAFLSLAAWFWGALTAAVCSIPIITNLCGG